MMGLIIEDEQNVKQPVQIHKNGGGTLDLRDTPLSEKYTEEEIRQMVNVGGSAHL